MTWVVLFVGGVAIGVGIAVLVEVWHRWRE